MAGNGAWETPAPEELAGPRPRRLRSLAMVLGVLLVVGTMLMWLRAAQGGLELGTPSWDCTGTSVVADPWVDDPHADPLLAPELVPGMDCWATWSVGSTARIPLVLESWHLGYGGPATGGAFRITGARVDGEDVPISSPPPPDDYDIFVPVGASLSGGERVDVSVRVEFGRGCTAEGRFMMWPTVRTTAWGVSRTASYSDERDDVDVVTRQRGLYLAGTPESSCSPE